MSLASQPALYFRDATRRETLTPFLSAQFDPAKSALLFAGSGHDFAHVAAAADSSGPVPSFPLPHRRNAKVAARRADRNSPNLTAVMPGADPLHSTDDVTLSHTLTGYGLGPPVHRAAA